MTTITKTTDGTTEASIRELLELVMTQQSEILEQQEAILEQLANLDRGTPGYGIERTFDDI